MQKESNELIEKINFTQKAHDESESRKQKIVEEIKVNEYKKKELESNELWKRKQEQHDMDIQIREIEQDLKNKEKSEDEKKSAIIKKENEEKQIKSNLEQERDKFKTTVNEIEQIATSINYDEFFFIKDEVKLEERYNYQPFKNDIKRFIDKIASGKKALEKEKLKRIRYRICG